MAPKRRSAGAATSRQATIAFHGHSNKVTKPSAVAPSKKTPKDSVHTETVVATDVKVEPPAVPDVDDTHTTEAAVIEQAQIEAVEPVTAEEEEASNISDTQIKKYWQQKEEERKAPRVHQEDVPLFERVCREWDTDGRFGPCMGIARIKRWKRAQKLGLKPPIEVLAILLKEQKEGNLQAQESHIDELMNSRFVEAG